MTVVEGMTVVVGREIVVDTIVLLLICGEVVRLIVESIAELIELDVLNVVTTMRKKNLEKNPVDACIILHSMFRETIDEFD